MLDWLSSAASAALAAAARDPLAAAGASALAALAALYWKALPLGYHVRTLWLVAHGLVRVRARGRPASFTAPAEHRERILLSELDYNMHANNAVYALMGDHARTKLFLPLYGGLGAFRAMPVYNAGVTTLFIREFRLFDPVVLRARVVSWEARKWLFVALEYTHGGTGELHALGLTKMCFKRGRRTVPPGEAFRSLGFADAPDALDNVEGTPYAAALAGLQARLEGDWGRPASGGGAAGGGAATPVGGDDGDAGGGGAGATPASGGPARRAKRS